VTLVRFGRFQPGPSGVDVPVEGGIGLRLVRREVASGAVRVVSAFTVPLVGGWAEVELSPTAVDQAWLVQEKFWGGRTEYAVRVPASGVWADVDLTEVDVESFDAIAKPPAAIVAELNDLRALVEDILENGAPAGPPTGGAGGALAGTYPNPGFNENALRSAVRSMSGLEVPILTPQGTWVIEHALGRRPNVAVFVNGEIVLVPYTATDTTVSVQHPTPTAGVAVLT